MPPCIPLGEALIPLLEDGQREAHTADLLPENTGLKEDTGWGPAQTTGVGPCDSPDWPEVPLGLALGGPRGLPRSRLVLVIKHWKPGQIEPRDTSQAPGSFAICSTAGRAECHRRLVSPKQGDRAGFKPEPRELSIWPWPCSPGLGRITCSTGSG